MLFLDWGEIHIPVFAFLLLSVSRREGDRGSSLNRVCRIGEGKNGSNVKEPMEFLIRELPELDMSLAIK